MFGEHHGSGVIKYRLKIVGLSPVNKTEWTQTTLQTIAAGQIRHCGTCHWWKPPHRFQPEWNSSDGGQILAQKSQRSPTYKKTLKFQPGHRTCPEWYLESIYSSHTYALTHLFPAAASVPFTPYPWLVTFLFFFKFLIVVISCFTLLDRLWRHLCIYKYILAHCCTCVLPDEGYQRVVETSH